ncbi:hypothetical protein DSL72_005514 [Monilinia vaccinii-corymbosi]|uniref:Maintenance of telomere capping protein 6 n=1 Tax=Monilinia vaccinii-corymbosi TaxID=61207 RepID=A0A8A3PFV3_9HELO|nr:hypothetical protein DSL72_005514 [Monilinia vaccinii-corymbosi]
MSDSYNPNTDALPESPWDTVFLAQRDLGLNIPINFATAPGVSLTAACFPFHEYEDDDSAVCLSNLLANGFRRLEVDLYWDQLRRSWTFCPAAIPVSASSIVSSPSPTSTLPSTSASLTSAQETTASTDLIARQDVGTGSIIAPSSTSGSGRGSTSSSLTRTMPAATLVATPLESTVPATSPIPNPSNKTLYNVGPYTCTTTISLEVLTSVLLGYIEKTQNTIDAHLLTVTLNIHAVESDADIDGPAPQPLILPDPLESLGSLFSSNLSAYIYTPGDLTSNRADLNSSWYSVTERHRPVLDYYTTATQEFGIVTTEDGWPTEAFIELSQGKRMLLQFGSVDPSMKKYNFDGDADTIFPQGYIDNRHGSNILASSDGMIRSGCLLDNSTENISQINSSWATAGNLPSFEYPTRSDSDPTSLFSLASSLTSCGISPTLNITLLNNTASANNPPYKAYVQSSIWSWAFNEPRNFSSSSSSTDNSDSLFRCAVLRSQTNRWHVTDCSTKLYAACRAPSQPYNWTLTTYSISYSYAPQACPSPYIFEAPRTALENAHLAQTLRNLAPSRNLDRDDAKVWLDFNSLEMKNCWTTGGPNATCPYTGREAILENITKKEIVVPTVAALIVLILTGFVLLGKCAGRRWRNWRSRGKRRRKRGGDVYEGVPA